MGSFFSFFVMHWERLALYSMLGFLILFVSWFSGYLKGREKLDDYRVRQATEAALIVVKQGKVSERVLVQYVQSKSKMEIVNRAVGKEVVRYVEKNPGSCLDADWSRLHNLSAGGSFPGASGGTHEAFKTPSAAEALSVVIDNYSICRENGLRLDALQDWVKSQENSSRD